MSVLSVRSYRESRATNPNRVCALGGTWLSWAATNRSRPKINRGGMVDRRRQTHSPHIKQLQWKGHRTMASVIRESNGRKTIQFVAPDGKRRPKVRLGKVPMRTANALKTKIEALVASCITGHAPDDETSRWVAGLDSAMLDKLSKVGLIESKNTTTLGPFLTAYIDGRCDVKPRTRAKYVSSHRNLVSYFGEHRIVRNITPGDADEWRLHMLQSGRAENTIRKHTAVAKLFFNAAVRRRLIESNPFVDLKAAIQPNPDRFYFITPEESAAVLAACPDAEWRLIFALGRFGGLRCPSEHLGLQWGDINWEHGRMHVRSPKTEHHVGGESRMVPLFPELRACLDECYHLAEQGEEFVIARYRDPNVNLRKRMTQIIRNAGLKPWPKLFQNLRSTRQTELEESWPTHVVCKWMGNSQRVAARHYLQVTEEHFEKAVRNPVQYSACSGSTEPQAGFAKPLDLQGSAGQCDTPRGSKIAEAGLEPARPYRDPGF